GCRRSKRGPTWVPRRRGPHGHGPFGLATMRRDTEVRGRPELVERHDVDPVTRTAMSLGSSTRARALPVERSSTSGAWREGRSRGPPFRRCDAPVDSHSSWSARFHRVGHAGGLTSWCLPDPGNLSARDVKHRGRAPCRFLVTDARAYALLGRPSM